MAKTLKRRRRSVNSSLAATSMPTDIAEDVFEPSKQFPTSGVTYSSQRMPPHKLHFKCTTCGNVGNIFVDDLDAYPEDVQKKMLTNRGWLVTPDIRCSWCAKHQHKM